MIASKIQLRTFTTAVETRPVTSTVIEDLLFSMPSTKRKAEESKQKNTEQV
jgi:hypothetical protein